MTDGERYWYERAVQAEKKLSEEMRKNVFIRIGSGPPMRRCEHPTFVHYVPECDGKSLI